MAFALQRLQADLNEIVNNYSLQIISVKVSKNNSIKVKIIFQGPRSTPYENGQFKLELNISEEFPFSPPEIIFNTKILHPNILSNGQLISSYIHPKNWTPENTIRDILDHIMGLLYYPDILSDECDLGRAYLYITKKEEFENMARKFTIKYANGQ